MPKLHAPLRWIGRRGASLLFLGLLVTLLGWSLIAHPPRDPSTLILMITIMPLKAWGIVWAASGLIMFAGAFWKRLETLGFGLGSSLFSIIATSFLYTLIFFTPPEWGGVVRGVAIYYGFAIWLQIISGWPEVPKIEHPADEA